MNQSIKVRAKQPWAVSRPWHPQHVSPEQSTDFVQIHVFFTRSFVYRLLSRPTRSLSRSLGERPNPTDATCKDLLTPRDDTKTYHQQATAILPIGSINRSIVFGSINNQLFAFSVGDHMCAPGMRDASFSPQCLSTRPTTWSRRADLRNDGR